MYVPLCAVPHDPPSANVCFGLPVPHHSCTQPPTTRCLRIPRSACTDYATWNHEARTTRLSATTADDFREWRVTHLLRLLSTPLRLPQKHQCPRIEVAERPSFLWRHLSLSSVDPFSMSAGQFQGGQPTLRTPSSRTVRIYILLPMEHSGGLSHYLGSWMASTQPRRHINSWKSRRSLQMGAVMSLLNRGRLASGEVKKLPYRVFKSTLCEPVIQVAKEVS